MISTFIGKLLEVVVVLQQSQIGFFGLLGGGGDGGGHGVGGGIV